MAKSFDVVIIGAGPAGYVAAIRCAQLGLNTACVDEWKNSAGQPSLGGTCVNVGCIPSKALLDSSENYERVEHKFAAHGIKVDGVHLDVGTMLARKDKIVRTLTSGVTGLFKKNKITSLHGHGRLVGGGGPWQIAVSSQEKTEQIEARHVIIATGSVPTPLPQAPVDNDRIVDNSGALAFPEVPKRLGVIGAGVIGLELGSVWRRLGAQVTVIERIPDFLPAVDAQVSKEALRLFTAQGLDIHLGASLTSVKVGKKQVNLEYQDKQGEHKLEVDKLIVAVGRSPYTGDLGADKIGLKLDAKGFILVDQHCRTNLQNVYAIGDVVRGPMLAHKGEEEGIMAAELIAGQAGHVNYETVPWIIYTMPEIAWVGQTEEALKAAGIGYNKGTFPFSANGRAQAIHETAGFVKILAHANTDRILGVHIIGPLASEMITEAVVAMEFSASAEDLARIIHAHPSLSEVFHEAALGVGKRAIHI